MGGDPHRFMQFMTEPNRIFIRCASDWSYRYIGGIKDFVPIDFKVMEKFYNVVGYYVTIRHNFITGHLDNTGYTQALDRLKIDTTEEQALWEYTLWEAETLYRQLRPFLNQFSVPIEKTHYLNDDRGEVLGFVVHLRQTSTISQMQ